MSLNDPCWYCNKTWSCECAEILDGEPRDDQMEQARAHIAAHTAAYMRRRDSMRPVTPAAHARPDHLPRTCIGCGSRMPDDSTSYDECPECLHRWDQRRQTITAMAGRLRQREAADAERGDK